MKTFLVLYTDTFKEFRSLEVEWLLNHIDSNYKVIQKCEEEHPYGIIECEEAEMKYVCTRSVFIKEVSVLNEMIHDDSKTGKIEVVTYKFSMDCGEKQKVIEENIHLLGNRKVDLSNPEYVVQIHLNHKRKYISVLYSKGVRKALLKKSISSRPFIGHTCMNWELSVFMANVCNVRKGDLVFDPCVGSGGIVLACALFGGLIVGSDKFKNELFGKNERKRNVKTCLIGKSFYDNFIEGKCEDKILGCIISDMFNLNIRNTLLFDSIVCDPPYGVRTSLNGFDNSLYIERVRDISRERLKANGYLGVWVPHRKPINIDGLFDGFVRVLKATQKLSVYSRTLFVYRKGFT
jgi:tRNA G10  N-methylase Trm11